MIKNEDRTYHFVKSFRGLFDFLHIQTITKFQNTYTTLRFTAYKNTLLNHFTLDHKHSKRSRMDWLDERIPAPRTSYPFRFFDQTGSRSWLNPLNQPVQLALFREVKILPGSTRKLLTHFPIFPQISPFSRSARFCTFLHVFFHVFNFFLS